MSRTVHRYGLLKSYTALLKEKECLNKELVTQFASYNIIDTLPDPVPGMGQVVRGYGWNADDAFGYLPENTTFEGEN